MRKISLPTGYKLTDEGNSLASPRFVRDPHPVLLERGATGNACRGNFEPLLVDEAELLLRIANATRERENLTIAIANTRALVGLPPETPPAVEPPYHEADDMDAGSRAEVEETRAKAREALGSFARIVAVATRNGSTVDLEPYVDLLLDTVGGSK